MATDDSSLWIISVVICFVNALLCGMAKLAIRKSWTMLQHGPFEHAHHGNNALFRDAETAQDSEEVKREKEKTKRLAIVIRSCALFQFSVVSPVVDMVAMFFSSPSIVAPFAGVALAWVVLLSPCIGEHPERIRVSGAVLILCGELLVAAFGDHVSNDQETLQEVRDSYAEPGIICFLIFSALFEMTMFYWINYSTNASLQRVAWGISGGYMAGLQNFIKDALTVWKLSEVDMPWQLPWDFWILGAIAGSVALGALSIMTMCFKRYDATYTAGAFAGSLVISASVMSSIHYHTFQHLEEGWVAVLYPLGLGTLLLGVCLLLKFSRYDDGHDEPESGDTQTTEMLRTGRSID